MHEEEGQDMCGGSKDCWANHERQGESLVLWPRSGSTASKGQGWHWGVRGWGGTGTAPTVPSLQHGTGWSPELWIHGPQADVLTGGNLAHALRGPVLLQFFSMFFLCLSHGHLELSSSPEPLNNLIISSYWPDCLSPWSGPHHRDTLLDASF